jgi:hypothetical protein
LADTQLLLFIERAADYNPWPGKVESKELAHECA